MTFKIFRKSENTNSFGLRGYWAFDQDTFEVISFASSTDFAKGKTLSARELIPVELLRHEGTVVSTQREDFLKEVNV